MERDDELLGRFRVEDFLRQGGMGQVWTARDIESGDLVVVKLLLDPWGGAAASSPERRRHRWALHKRFERECDLLDKLRHAGIPRLLDRGYEGSDPYMVMEHINGPALDEFIKRHTLTSRMAAAIMTELLKILSFAHGERVVHRDVKPHNIIVGMDNRVHLIDFGIAYLTDPDATRYTEEGATPGSLGYKAPELIEGGDVTRAADVYGAGCVYYMLLTGKKPFAGSSGRSVEYQHLKDVPVRVRDRVAHIAPAIDDVIARMLAKDPADRPTPEEIIEVLRPHLPRPGDPAPDPLPSPDPTLRFRDPDGQGRPADVERSPQRERSRRSSRPGVDRPSRTEYDQLLAQAQEEIDAGEPGKAIARLEQTMTEVERAWGQGHPPIARARLRCGDAARLEGVWARARARYREVDKQLADDTSREGTELHIEAQIGIAECLATEELLEEAVAEWVAAAGRTLALRSVPRTLVRRLREVAVDIQERGHGSPIEPHLDRLPEEPDDQR